MSHVCHDMVTDIRKIHNDQDLRLIQSLTMVHIMILLQDRNYQIDLTLRSIAYFKSFIFFRIVAAHTRIDKLWQQQL